MARLGRAGGEPDLSRAGLLPRLRSLIVLQRGWTALLAAESARPVLVTLIRRRLFLGVEYGCVRMVLPVQGMLQICELDLAQQRGVVGG